MTSKRIVDLIAGVLLGTLALPLIGLFGLIVVVELGTQPFFVQQRVGRNGRLFRMPKLRTLPRDLDPYASKTSFHDGDVPPFCRFLRRSHLDELPQLLLVPLGRMSLVGPRPKMPDWAEPIDPTHSLVRTRMTPGCTGLWQVSRDTHLRVTDCPDHDYYYARNAGLRLDLWILWRTIVVLVARRGVSLSEVPRWAWRRAEPWPIALGKARREHPALWALRERDVKDFLRDVGR